MALPLCSIFIELDWGTQLKLPTERRVEFYCWQTKEHKIQLVTATILRKEVNKFDPYLKGMRSINNNNLVIIGSGSSGGCGGKGRDKRRRRCPMSLMYSADK